MKKNFFPLLLLAVLRYASGCLGPTPMDSPVICDQIAVTRILNTPTNTLPDVIDVEDGVDSYGSPFQTTTIMFGSTEYVDPGSMAVLTINGQPQNTTIWNGRRVGLGRPIQITENGLEHNFCPNSASFWRAPVGFGTTGIDRLGSQDPGYSVVGRPLVEGQEIEIRIDVCAGNTCTPGISRKFKVHLT